MPDFTDELNKLAGNIQRVCENNQLPNKEDRTLLEWFASFIHNELVPAIACTKDYFAREKETLTQLEALYRKRVSRAVAIGNQASDGGSGVQT